MLRVRCCTECEIRYWSYVLFCGRQTIHEVMEKHSSGGDSYGEKNYPVLPLKKTVSYCTCHAEQSGIDYLSNSALPQRHRVVGTTLARTGEIYRRTKTEGRSTLPPTGFYHTKQQYPVIRSSPLSVPTINSPFLRHKRPAAGFFPGKKSAVSFDAHDFCSYVIKKNFGFRSVRAHQSWP